MAGIAGAGCAAVAVVLLLAGWPRLALAFAVACAALLIVASVVRNTRRASSQQLSQWKFVTASQSKLTGETTITVRDERGRKVVFHGKTGRWRSTDPDIAVDGPVTQRLDELHVLNDDWRSWIDRSSTRSNSKVGDRKI